MGGVLWVRVCLQTAYLLNMVIFNNGWRLQIGHFPSLHFSFQIVWNSLEEKVPFGFPGRGCMATVRGEQIVHPFKCELGI